ncbi:histone-lysine N-methyltransferase EZ3-like [Salvia hispanica]|uniref:histone-lysine N-methyltransferase EZ3-like n=1 Tax=Salvia hispanica TaxID=49212 RepID=UPI0020099EA0|nr:histone-lysine N-methyltransferase EZ3-like [Salvia hispanica]
MVSISKFKKQIGEHGIDSKANLASSLSYMKMQIQNERFVSIKEKLENNSKNIESYVSHLKELAASRVDSTTSSSGNHLSLRMNHPLSKLSGLVQGSEDDTDNKKEVVFSETTKLPLIERIPSYTTWIFLDRNKIMADDRRRHINYDHHGNEALICSDNEDDLVQLEDEKHKFSDGEDRLIRMAFSECGIGNGVVDVLTQFVGGSSQEIQERCTVLMETDQQMEIQKKPLKEKISGDNMYLGQSLSTALDSFDNLFCRRCLVFNCRLHCCSQAPTCHNEKQIGQFVTEVDHKPCGDQCYLQQTCKSTGNSIKASLKWSNWSPLEKDLYLKGLQIFGRNSCFIARNLLVGLKTCEEVSIYMSGDGAVMPCGSSAKVNSNFVEAGRDGMDLMEPDMPGKSRISRKRGRVRKGKVKSSRKYRQSLWRMIVEGKDIPYKQYSPCICQPTCGKQCPCLQNGACCEKYCGCSKRCKNRFRGCYCAKGQCKSQQCPCFAAKRECDPDVCRSCWISCGDGSLRGPPRRGNSQCANMVLLLRQHQRILLAKSDIVGWGAFVKNPVNKDDYLGEYTGELISHQEADRRGKIYDRADMSYLFNLNDKYVIDAYRKGDKLKFANHSSNPNCYARVMLVAGDHRVGIYANEQIQAGEEIFFDYRYGPDESPAWALKPTLSKKDGLPLPRGRAKKHKSS